VGEAQNQAYQLSLNPALKVDFQGSLVASDDGLFLVRESGEYLPFPSSKRKIKLKKETTPASERYGSAWDKERSFVCIIGLSR